MSDTKQGIWKELRKPFPKEVVGQIPKGGRMLDYVGHAAVTDRLLEVDPQWSWEPMAHTEAGSPALDEDGNLWIKLSVSGVTRIGVGDGPNMKERIGDALRNAAMRFGVALDLWSKEELESTLADPGLKNDKPSKQASKPAVGTAKSQEQVAPSDRKLVNEAQAKLLLARARDASGLSDRQEVYDYFLATFGVMPNEVYRDEVNEILRQLTTQAGGATS